MHIVLTQNTDIWDSRDQVGIKWGSIWPIFATSKTLFMVRNLFLTVFRYLKFFFPVSNEFLKLILSFYLYLFNESKILVQRNVIHYILKWIQINNKVLCEVIYCGVVGAPWYRMHMCVLNNKRMYDIIQVTDNVNIGTLSVQDHLYRYNLDC